MSLSAATVCHVSVLKLAVSGGPEAQQARLGGLARAAALVAVLGAGAPAVSAGSAVLTAGSAGAATTVTAVFVKVLPALLRSHVPLYLPTVFPGVVKSHLHVSLGPVPKGAYEVDISTVANCNGADACTWGWVSGERSPQGYKFPAKDVPVSLGANIKGEYSPGSCGASCSGVSVDWLVHGYLYSAGGYMDRSQVVALARSAVAAGPYSAG